MAQGSRLLATAKANSGNPVSDTMMLLFGFIALLATMTVWGRVQRDRRERDRLKLLVDERPEEVTDFRRNVPCTVWASSNDHAPERQVGLVQLAMDRCKRWAEQGKNVVVLLDSLTRVGRAFNTAP